MATTTMNRRSAIKTCLIFTAGAALVPSCLQERSKSSLLLKNIDISSEQEKLMAELSETIIPKTNTPGAKDVSAHLFALMMVDDCYKPEEQKKFVSGLKDFDEITRKKFGKSFVECSPGQRHALVAEMEVNKDGTGNISAFYKITKSLTIHSFTSSQYYLTKVRVYEMVPGRFHGCVPVNNKA